MNDRWRQLCRRRVGSVMCRAQRIHSGLWSRVKRSNRVDCELSPSHSSPLDCSKGVSGIAIPGRSLRIDEECWVHRGAETNGECLVLESRSYPKIEVRQGKTRWRYATSMSLGEAGFLELSHHVNTEMYVDTRKWARSSGDTGLLLLFRFRSSRFSSRETILAKTE